MNPPESLFDRFYIKLVIIKIVIFHICFVSFLGKFVEGVLVVLVGDYFAFGSLFFFVVEQVY